MQDTEPLEYMQDFTFSFFCQRNLMVVGGMSAIKQQLVIDESIAAYIANYDRIASQYLALRQSILALAPDAPAHEVQQLRYELARAREQYTQHVETLELKRRLGQPPAPLEELTRQLDELSAAKSGILREIDHLTRQKPMLEQMRAMLKGFELALKRAKPKAHAPAPVEFDELQLRALLGSALERFDEPTAAMIDEFVASRVERGRFVHDARSAEKGLATVAAYDEMIEAALGAIEELLASGAEARQRWNANAAKVDAMKEAANV